MNDFKNLWAPPKMKEIHIWHHCHHCGMKPIVEERFHCTSCPAGPDTDLCGKCFKQYSLDNSIHPLSGTHSFVANEHNFVQSRGRLGTEYVSWLKVLSRNTGRANISIPKGFLVRPEFRSQRNSFFGSHGFVVQIGNKVLVLTALHVLDELIKDHNIDCSINNKDFSARELAMLVDGVNLYDILEQRWMFHKLGRASPMLELQDARTEQEEPSSSRDIAAFVVKDPSLLAPMRLAKKTPDVGEPVWLAAKTEAKDNVHQAVVVEKNQESFIFGYNAEVQFRATSGAPILNSDGEVVAINVGAGKYENYSLGHGNHVDNIRRHLESFL